jgi:uncharacterized protein involved in response to NO
MKGVPQMQRIATVSASFIRQLNRPIFRHPVFNLGFRPLFLLAGVFATLLIPLWLALFAGLWPAPAYLGPLGWHAHEMLYGYTMAVVAGFLLTAVRNWTSLPTPSGPLLAGLALLWLMARFALIFTVLVPAWLVAVIDVSFLPAIAGVLLLPLWRSGNFRNLIFPFILLALTGANLVIHLQALGVLASGSDRALQFALNAVTLIMVVIGGRVIPFFTTNVLPEAQVCRIAWADRLAIGLVMLVLVIDLFPFPYTFAGPVALLAAAVNIVRMLHWRSLATRRVPMLWILHIGYGWIIAALALKGLAGMVPMITPSAAIHALTVGAIGSLTLGMMSRVALGHTGRAIAASTTITAAFALITASAILRVAIPIAMPGFYWPGLILSGLLWSMAFALFVIHYTPILTRPRIDGKPG